MQKLKIFLITFITFVLLAGCQTIKEKTNKIAEKENEKLSKYISKPASILQMDLGKPDEDFTNSKGNFELINQALIGVRDIIKNNTPATSTAPKAS